MHNKTKLRIHHRSPLKPWKVVRGQYRSVTVYQVQGGKDGKFALQSRLDRQRYFTTTSSAKILGLASLLADSPPVPKLKRKKLTVLIHKRLRREVTVPNPGK